MNDLVFIQDWRQHIRYSNDGPGMTILTEGTEHKALLAGLEPEGRIPPHPERLGLYHVLDGTGSMTVDGEWYPLTGGATVIAPEGSVRGFEAETRLAFIAVRIGPEPSSTP